MLVLSVSSITDKYFPRIFVTYVETSVLDLLGAGLYLVCTYLWL